MSELNIKDPCLDCPLFVGSGEDARTIYERRLWPMSEDGVDRALGCKHPWRVALKGMGIEPTDPQLRILSLLVEIRGRNPSDYGLEPSGAEPVEVDLSPYETIIESLADEFYQLLSEETVGHIQDIVTLAESGDFGADTLQGLLSSLATNDLDVPTEVFDRALQIAQDRVLRSNEP